MCVFQSFYITSAKHFKLKYPLLLTHHMHYQPYFNSDHSLDTRDKFAACNDMLTEFIDFLKFIINKAHRHVPSKMSENKANDGTSMIYNIYMINTL